MPLTATAGTVSLQTKRETSMTNAKSYRAGVAVALLASVLTVWTTVVRDDSTGIGYFMVILAAAVGGFAAWFRPAGMARTMAGVAMMQLLLGIAIATAPSTADIPGGPGKVMLFNLVFAALWLGSAMLFRAAWTADRMATAAD